MWLSERSKRKFWIVSAACIGVVTVFNIFHKCIQKNVKGQGWKGKFKIDDEKKHINFDEPITIMPNERYTPSKY